MPSLRDLCKRRCAEDLIHVLQQVPARVAARLPIALDDTSLATIVFWTLLRWERRFWIDCLQELGVDVWSLTCELDALLERKQIGSESHPIRVDEAHGPWSQGFRRRLDQLLAPLLDRAAGEAAAMGNGTIGNEHLLLAILAHPDAPLASLLSRHAIHYPAVKNAIIDATSQMVSVEVVEEPMSVTPFSLRKPWWAAWDSGATGVPRRFSMAALFFMMTLYAVIFATMQSLDANPTFFAVIAILVTGVGVGQPLLFGGKYPRAASVCVGAFLFPVEVLVIAITQYASSSYTSLSADVAGWLFLLMCVCIPAGALLGYLAGGLTAGVFVVLDLLAKKTQREDDRPPQEPPIDE